MSSNNNNNNNNDDDDDKLRLTRLAEEREALKLKLAAKIEERELLLEKRRVEQVKQLFAEERSRTYKKTEDEDCPICIETLQGEEIDDAMHCTCCGKIAACQECQSSTASKLDKCPLCRADFPSSDIEKIAAMKKLARKGTAWAQYSLAHSYACGTNGVEVNDELAFEWYYLAAEQGYSKAMLKLAIWHVNLDNVPDRTDYSEASRWFQATIDKGHQRHAIKAMKFLGMMKYAGYGEHQDRKEAVRLFPLIVTFSPDDPTASINLGECFLRGEGQLEKSLDCAKYYFRLATKCENVSNPGLAHYRLGQTLYDLSKERYYGRIDIPGHSLALYWARKALAMGYDNAAAFIERVEQEMKSSCANCKRSTDESTVKRKGGKRSRKNSKRSRKSRKRSRAV